MSKATRNRKTRRMAKNIVLIFAVILKEGVPKWATRDITPEALAAQAKNNELNIDVILSFDGETQVHVMQYFKNMCEAAKDLGDIPKELKEELEEDLYDLLIEKGVTPTPLQSTMLTLGAILAHVGLKTYGFRIQIASVKEIISTQKGTTVDVKHEEVPPQEQPPQPPQEPPNKTSDPQPSTKPTGKGKGKKKAEQEGNYEDLPISKKMLEIGDKTKE